MKNLILILVLLITGFTINSLKAQGSWTLQTNPLGSGDAAMLGKVQFVSATEGWISVSGSGSLLHTTNSGINWTQVTLPFPNDVVWSLSDPSVNMCFINATTGWLIKSIGTSVLDSTGAVVYKTTNGGLNWQKIMLSGEANDIGLQIQFVDANNGWASTFNVSDGTGKYFKSTDGGATWNLIPSGDLLGFYFFVDSNNGWGISADLLLGPPYTIYHTTNGGLNWALQYTDNTEGGFSTIHFTDLNNDWVVGDSGKILKTTNGGTTWSPVTNAGLVTESYNSCVYFLNANIGWIGNNPYNNPPFVLHTTNGGTSWTTQNTTLYDENIFSLFFWDQNNGWFTADYGAIGRFYNPLGIEENSLNKSISVYPNPTNGKFCIDLKEPKSKMEVEIYNVLGQKIYESLTQTPLSTNEINFDPQSKGVYLIKINDGETSYTETIVVQ
jgi:photosystem II stability/assembly factor-like uncharacterized protein